MFNLFKPTKSTLLALLVLLIGTFILPLIYNFLYNYYVISTHTPDQLAQMMRQRPNVGGYFIIQPLLSFVWLYIIGCVIVALTKKPQKSSK